MHVSIRPEFVVDVDPSSHWGTERQIAAPFCKLRTTKELPKKHALFRLPSISTTSGCGSSSEIEQFQGLLSPHLHAHLIFETSDFDRPTIRVNVISKVEVANGTGRWRSFCSSVWMRPV